MTTHTENTAKPATPLSSTAMPPLLILEPSATSPKSEDDWRLSRSAKPLRTWRLSK